MYNLKVILASTRPSRKGPAVADWIMEILKKHTEFEVELLDLKEINLPMMDEPEHPRFKKYTKEHTKKWSEIIDKADGFVIVTCEYNFGYPAPLKNALDYLFQEWNDKPVAFVSYGGVAGGTRSVQQLRQVVGTLKMIAVSDAVHIPHFTKRIGEDGKFNSDESLDKSAETMIAEVIRWLGILKNG